MEIAYLLKTYNNFIRLSYEFKELADRMFPDHDPSKTGENLLKITYIYISHPNGIEMDELFNLLSDLLPKSKRGTEFYNRNKVNCSRIFDFWITNNWIEKIKMLDDKRKLKIIFTKKGKSKLDYVLKLIKASK